MSNKLYVGGLSYATTNDSLEALFQRAGQVLSAQVITDRDTGRSGVLVITSASKAQRTGQRAMVFSLPKIFSASLRNTRKCPASERYRPR